MYYIQQDEKIVLFDTEKERLINTLAFMPQYEGLEILETDREIIELNNEFVFKDEVEAELEAQKKARFEKDFFLTSLGYIRRNVSMATGETKDFLCDLLPAITTGITLGQEIPIITYKKPDFTQEFNLEYLESLQEIKIATQQFCTECALQISADFMGQPITLSE